eukprot:130921-Lingulodinium_polyedra.AAC.1
MVFDLPALCPGLPPGCIIAVLPPHLVAARRSVDVIRPCPLTAPVAVKALLAIAVRPVLVGEALRVPGVLGEGAVRGQ